jgi:hypothetical protein
MSVSDGKSVTSIQSTMAEISAVLHLASTDHVIFSPTVGADNNFLGIRLILIVVFAAA